MDVTVIVVTYNQESTIGRTLDSILSQEFSGSYEIVIGDDCSSDGTERVCREYASRYPGIIRYERREKNMGVALNYFDCILNARGRYIADCAGDDYWVDVLKLQREFDFLESHDDVTMVVTDWLCVDSETGNLFRMKENPEIGDQREWAAGGLVLPMLRQELTLHLCSSLYRRDPVLGMLNREPDQPISDLACEDLPIFLATSVAGKTVQLPGVTLHYSVGHDSISHRKDSGVRARQSLKALRQTVALSRKFVGDFTALKDSLDRRLDYVWAHLFKGKERALRREVLAFEEETGIKGGKKSMIYRIVTKGNLSWRVGLGLRKLVGEASKN